MALRGFVCTTGLLVALCALAHSVCATVVLQSNNFSTGFADLPADFGPEIPQEGIQGLLLVADPEHACSELRPPPASITSPWVALVVRSQEISGCTFDMKVAHAEQAGAIAAIIYDDVFEPLVLMAKDPRHPDPFIPAAFVSHRSGLMMKRLTEEGKTVVTLTPSSEQLWLSMLMSACAGFLAVNVVLGALWVIRRQRIVPGSPGGAGYGTLQRQGMTEAEIRQLPIVVYEEPAAARAESDASAAAAAAAAAGAALEGGDSGSGSGGTLGDQQQPRGPGSDSGSDSGRKGGGTRHTCAICLESYCHGEKLRVLPCQHRYHSECVDTWLANRHPICPVCKADAHARTPDSDVEAGAGPATAPPWRRRGALLVGRLGGWGGWRVLRRHLAGGGGDGGAGAGAAGAAAVVGGGELPAEQQLLLAGSGRSSPIPVEGEPALAAAEGPASYPISAASSPSSRAAAQPEIQPADAAEPPAGPAVEQAAPPAPASSSGWHASPPRSGAGPTRGISGSHGGPAGGPSSSGSSQPGPPSLQGSPGPAQVLPDSTEGSETESEAE
ncbi:hypothetical protein ABPG75_001312 [Micractinium tetrahymenae]